MEKERITLRCIFKSTSLVCKVNPSIIKVKMSINKDTTPIKEVVNSSDDQSIGKAKAKVKGVPKECDMDGGSIVIKYITKLGGIRWGGKTNNGTDGKSGGSEKV